MSSYTFNINQNILLSDFQNYLTTNNLTPGNCTFNSGTLVIYFPQSLTNTQQTLLTNLISNYTFPTFANIYYTLVNITTFNYYCTSSTFTVLFLFNWVPPTDGSFLSSINILCHLNTPNPGGTNNWYKLQIFDSTNNNILETSNQLSQTSYLTICLNNLINIPSDNAIIEIQAMVNNPSTDTLVICSCDAVYDITVTN